MTIKALVFDFDGLILDTETPEYEAWQQVYREYGTELELADWLLCVGTSQEAFNPLDHLKSRVHATLDDRDILNRQKALFLENMQAQTPMPGVTDYIATAEKMGLKLAIASSSPRDWVTGFMKKLQLLSSFTTICTRDDVEIVKPDPALYQCAVQQLGVEPSEAIAFEDSLNGLRSAKAAGLYCVVIPNSVTRQLEFPQADRLITSMADLSLGDLMKHFNGRRSP